MADKDQDITNRELLDAMIQQLGVITDSMVTKQDLKYELERFATKKDLKDTLKNYPTKKDLKDALKNYPTKKDLKDALKNYPTKKDLKKELKCYATKDDLGALEGRLEDRFDKVYRRFDRLGRQIKSSHSVNVAHHLETRAMISDLYAKTASD